MGNKINLLFVLLFFGSMLSIMVTAQGGEPLPPEPTTSNSTIKMPKEQKQALASVALDSFEVSGLECDGTTCKAQVFKQDAINKEIIIPEKQCIETDEITGKCTLWQANTEAELKQLRDEELKKLLEMVAKATITRQTPPTPTTTKLDPGTITVEEAK